MYLLSLKYFSGKLGINRYYDIPVYFYFCEKI